MKDCNDLPCKVSRWTYSLEQKNKTVDIHTYYRFLFCFVFQLHPVSHNDTFEKEVVMSSDD